jgi:SAM-dependent methyltransferase
MKTCRICGALLSTPVYTSFGPSITSVRSISDTPLSVYICPNCFHVQKPALQHTFNYYDKEYRISLESDDFDQLYDKVDNRYIYRTDYQAELALNSVNIPSGSEILDYGAGKASTLMKISAMRPDLIPYVFDVSDNYKENWQKFLPPEQQATYLIPESWKNKFSLITAHFVFEHAEVPCLLFNNIADLLTKDGFIFFTVPNLLTNIGDLITVDHINHFSITSINAALNKANLTLVKFDTHIFRGAIIGLAIRREKADFDNHIDNAGFSEKVNAIVKYWSDFDTLLDKATQKYNHAPSAIFGAGVYGSYIASKIMNRVLLKCFLDNSPHLINCKHMGFPVISPYNIPEYISVIYSGLNPSIARSVLEPLKTDRISKIIYFDEGAFNNDCW